MKLALITFDGLDPRVVYRSQEDMPNLHAFMEESMHGEMKTPGHTIPSYTAVLTGKQYNKYDFYWDEPTEGYQRHRQTGYDFLWDVSDSSMTLLNIPTLYPPEPIDDCMVCGFLTPDRVQDSNLARPMELQEELLDMDYLPDIPADDTYDELGGPGMLNLLNQMMHERVDVADMLIDKYDSDLFYGVWTAPDRWFHQCDKHNLKMMPMYEMVDEVFGEILEILPDDVPVIAFSDHGFAHFRQDDGVHKGHMYSAWYAIRSEKTPNFRDNSVSIFDLYPTVLNYLDGGVPEDTRGRILFHTDEQDQDVRNRLGDLGYLE